MSQKLALRESEAEQQRLRSLAERMAAVLVEALWFVEECEQRKIGQAGTTAAAIRAALQAKLRLLDGAAFSQRGGE